jgi:EAL domain-containing protein (putative c-di-GMP-specific phosphodiesterase class I)
VLTAAYLQAREWQLEHRRPTPFSVSVNISSWQLIQRDFVDRVAFALDQAGLAASALVLEITETTLMHDTDRSILTLCALRSMGVRIAIDDFGTGYSSLSYAPAIVSLAATLGLLVVAEGVETEFQADTLRRVGCELAQGCYFARPLDPEAMGQLLVDPPRFLPVDVLVPTAAAATSTESAL